MAGVGSSVSVDFDAHSTADRVIVDFCFFPVPGHRQGTGQHLGNEF